jgi:hypothetical protein
MRRINIIVFIIIAFLSAPASAQFYKYVDEDGNIRFTDDINQVPEQQRATVKSYEEAVSDTDVQNKADQSDSEASTNAQQKTAAAEAGVDIDLKDLDAAYDQLKALRQEIDKEYNDLMAEKEALAKAKTEAKTREQVLEYNAKVEQFNERAKAHQQKSKKYEAQVDAYNTSVSEQIAEQKKEKSE